MIPAGGAVYRYWQVSRYKLADRFGVPSLGGRSCAAATEEWEAWECLCESEEACTCEWEYEEPETQELEVAACGCRHDHREHDEHDDGLEAAFALELDRREPEPAGR